MSEPTASRPHRRPLAVSRSEAARRLGVGIGTLDRLIRDGRLFVVRAGDRVLVPVAALDALLDPFLNAQEPGSNPGSASEPCTNAESTLPGLGTEPRAGTVAS
ncbi:MAG: excisionase family DNA-binding protein [Actinomycetota bacterium]|nr:excisionase family DNA-binding protein [Actinomycetota bacterium]